jgi:hypothetical protein
VRHPYLSFIVSLAVIPLLHRGAAAQHTMDGAQDMPAAAADSGGVQGKAVTGKVVETMNAGGYTYLSVDDGSKKIWAAAPQLAVAVGDRVVVPAGMPMENFTSKTLGRTFDVVWFVSGVQVVGSGGGGGGGGEHPGSPAAAMAAHGAAVDGNGAHGAAAPGVAPDVDLSNIKKAAGGQTVGELFDSKAALTGKEVSVRGRVVKLTPMVMGKNWLHLRDGTGSAGKNDLTISTSAAAAVGNTVLARGKLSTDRDLGAGYHYDVIIEDADVTVE